MGESLGVVATDIGTATFFSLSIEEDREKVDVGPGSCRVLVGTVRDFRYISSDSDLVVAGTAHNGLGPIPGDLGSDFEEHNGFTPEKDSGTYFVVLEISANSSYFGALTRFVRGSGNCTFV